MYCPLLPECYADTSDCSKFLNLSLFTRPMTNKNIHRVAENTACLLFHIVEAIVVTHEQR